MCTETSGVVQNNEERIKVLMCVWKSLMLKQEASFLITLSLFKVSKIFFREVKV